ncbi:helix-turn-helix transcriptional regulator [Lysinibacillus sp. NPDC086135]|uniref:helix-turn-helix transcriptional regulator n=1 Tax=Lysinibacillus sp. NPDC086135 TaxID=3364130 RepID=UPI0038118A40
MSVYFVKKYLIKIDDRFFTAKKAIQRHIENEHISVFEALLQLNKEDTGLSDIQTELLKLFATGAPDKEIVNSTSANSISTIRQHRFKLKEKEKQAKVFLAIMQALETTKVYESIHKGATQVNERYAITEDDKEKVLATYFKNGFD